MRGGGVEVTRHAREWRAATGNVVPPAELPSGWPVVTHKGHRVRPTDRHHTHTRAHRSTKITDSSAYGATTVK